MIDPFEELLRELGSEYGISLHLDKMNACSLKMSDHLNIQLECDPHRENILAVAFICDLPPGKFREDILRDALKSNGPFPQNGTLSYSDRNNKLALFSRFPLANLNGHKLAASINAFVEKANQWRIGIETGTTASLVYPT